VENLLSVTTIRDVNNPTVEERMERIDTLLCILFSGLTSHPLANTLIPPAELAQLRAMLPKDIPPDGEA
jgi:hypothetical protein